MISDKDPVEDLHQVHAVELANATAWLLERARALRSDQEVLNAFMACGYCMKQLERLAALAGMNLADIHRDTRRETGRKAPSWFVKGH